MQMIPRAEYPRPRLVREDWLNLNGTWEFELDNGESGAARRLWGKEHLDQQITVPFCPESRLSGIAHTDFIRGCWYRRNFTLPESWKNGRVLLHFGAVNYKTILYVNGHSFDAHEGGYISFTRDITSRIHEGENTIDVEVHSDVRSGNQPSGKQSVSYESRGCNYTRTTGIWQTVWLEHVPEVYIEKLFVTPDLANKGVHIKAVANSYVKNVAFAAKATFEGSDMGSASCNVNGKVAEMFLPLSEVHLWEAGHGRLYDLELTLGEDRAQGYFGMRSVSLEGPSFLLNGKPLFQRTVLDQGFNPEGIITAPTDEHLRHDIEESMAMGFNGARLHQKIFEERFLYWADKLGYLVWEEHGNWGLDVTRGESLLHFLPEWIEAVERDYNSPAIIGWCPFNETDKNTDLRILQTVYQTTKALDPTRPCIDTSGWMHCEFTDIYDYHDYESNAETLRENLKNYIATQPGELFPRLNASYASSWRQNVCKGQPVFLSEFGGIGFFLEKTAENSWGYGNIPTTVEQYLQRLYAVVDVCLNTQGLMGFCYTQLTDVEQELNGLLTYTRKEKFSMDALKAIFGAPAWNEK